jgi:hypothetical protein
LALAKKDDLPLSAWVVLVNHKGRIESAEPVTTAKTERKRNGVDTMDPNACFERWANAIARDDDDAEAAEAAEDLIRWINRGGFEPRLWKQDPALRRIFVRWVQKSMTPREDNPRKKAAKADEGAKADESKSETRGKAKAAMPEEDFSKLVAALKKFGATVLKNKPKSFSKSDAVMGIVLASDLDRKEVLKAVRKALPPPKKAPPTEEEKAARLAKRVASCERLLAGRSGGTPAEPAAPAGVEDIKIPVPKRGRGRPRKERTEPEAPKRPRGRPRKDRSGEGGYDRVKIPVPAAPKAPKAPKAKKAKAAKAAKAKRDYSGVKIPVPKAPKTSRKPAKAATVAAPTIEVEVKPSGSTVVEITPPVAPVAPVAAPVVAPARTAEEIARDREEIMAAIRAAMAGG